MENLATTITGCVAGDPRAQRLIYEHYFGYCLKIVFRYIYRYDEALDVVNDAFVKVFKNFHKFSFSNDPKNADIMLMGWLKRIMINTAIDQLRRNNFLPEIGILSENIWVEDHSQAPDQKILYKELVKEIKKLPPSYRLAFNMFVIDGFSHQQIADQLNISIGTSKSNLSKARALLQKILKNNEEELKYAVSK
ncbi:MAG: sigma-70 family RNA polymerase sigma factor [Flavisolibacter sp.]